MDWCRENESEMETVEGGKGESAVQDFLNRTRNFVSSVLPAPLLYQAASFFPSPSHLCLRVLSKRRSSLSDLLKCCHCALLVTREITYVSLVRCVGWFRPTPLYCLQPGS